MRRRFCLCWILILCAALPAYPRQAEQRGLRLIVVESLVEAEDLRARILAGEEFALLAGEHSADVSRAAEGYLGVVNSGDLRREYQRALDGLGPGEVSPVASVPEGYALLQWLTDEEQVWMARRNAGLEAVATGRYADAGESFDAALEVAGSLSARPSLLATSLNDQAELYRRQGRYAPAAASYRRSLMLWEGILGRDHPSMATSLNNLAEVCRLQGNHDDALALYDRALALWEETLGPGHPNVAAALNNLALVRLARAEYAEARPLAERALAIWGEALGPNHPNVASALNSLGNIHRFEGEYEEAENLYMRSLAIWERIAGPADPNLAALLRGLADLELLAEDYDAAIGLYTRVLGLLWTESAGTYGGESLKEVVARLLDLLAGNLVGSGPSQAAADEFLGSMDEVSATPGLYVSMSRILANAGLTDLAMDLVSRAVGRFPEDRFARYRHAEMLSDTGRLGHALDALEAARRIQGSTPPIERILTKAGELYAGLGRFDDAIGAYRSALEAHPGRVDARIGLGNAYLSLNDPEAALAQYEAAASEDPKAAEAHYRVAEAALGMGLDARAVAAADVALGLDPGHRQAHYVRGRALARLGRTAESREALAAYQRLLEDVRLTDARLLEIVVARRDAVASLDDADYARAVRVLREAIAAHPDASRLRLTLGVIEYDAGEYAAAAETFRNLVDGGLADDSLTHYRLSQAYLMLEDREAARRHEAMYLRRIHSELDAGRPR